LNYCTAACRPFKIPEQLFNKNKINLPEGGFPDCVKVIKYVLS
jgi:hypothetical protein